MSLAYVHRLCTGLRWNAPVKCPGLGCFATNQMCEVKFVPKSGAHGQCGQWCSSESRAEKLWNLYKVQFQAAMGAIDCSLELANLPL